MKHGQTMAFLGQPPNYVWANGPRAADYEDVHGYLTNIGWNAGRPPLFSGYQREVPERLGAITLHHALELVQGDGVGRAALVSGCRLGGG